MRTLLRLCGLFVALGFTTFTAHAQASGADLTGKWTGPLDVNGQTFPMVLDLKTSGDAITGTISSPSGPVEIHEAKLAGDSLTFWSNTEYQGQTFKIVYQGKVAGDSINFNLGTEDGSWSSQMTLKREGAATPATGSPANGSATAPAAAPAAAADATGQWKGTWDFNGNPMPLLFDLKSSGGTVTGNVTGMGPAPIEIHDGKQVGDTVTFWINTDYQGQTYTLQYKGKVANGEINFDFGIADGSWGSSVTVKKV